MGSDETSEQRSALWNATKLAAGPLAGVLVYALLGLVGGGELAADAGTPSDAARAVAGLLAWMATWWLTEAIPLPATSLLPLVVLPVAGVVTVDAAAQPYASPIIFLFMGGFMLALAMERSDLHRRIALLTMRLFGDRPAMLVAGFMLSTALLSMWVSNTATAVMMLPIATSIIALVGETTGEEVHRFGTCVLLGIAYAASIGGVATPIGTPPNGILLGLLDESLDLQIGFTRWMAIGLPFTALLLPCTWVLLTRVLCPVGMGRVPGGANVVRDELRRIGPPTRAEWTVFVVFLAAVAAWLSRSWWSEAIDPSGTSGLRGMRADALVAVAAGLVLFVVPTDLRRGAAPLDWQTARQLPWGVLLLFGGGLSLAGAVTDSGLDAFIGAQAELLHGTPPILVILVATAVVVFLTEVTSNTATATIFVTVMLGAAEGLGVDPVKLAVPSALAASCAFMMPVATPPNAIVYGSGRLTIRNMATTGVWLNLLCIAAITLLAATLLEWFPLAPEPAP